MRRHVPLLLTHDRVPVLCIVGFLLVALHILCCSAPFLPQYLELAVGQIDDKIWATGHVTPREYCQGRSCAVRKIEYLNSDTRELD
jgi:hypothetical protein